MNNKIYTLLSILILLPACFFNNTQSPTAKRTYFIQGLLGLSVLTQIKKAIHPVINDSIKEELGLEKDYNFDFFSPKPRQAVTLYYVYDIYENGQEALFSTIDDIVLKNKAELMAQTTTLKSEVNFFGGPFGVNDELVVMIDDPDGNLTLLNQAIKEALHHANEEYKNKHQLDLYDVAKSEQYPYVPHIALGRVRSNSIKQHVKDEGQFDQVFERIQQNIKKAVTRTVEELLTLENKKVIFNKLCIFDFEKRECTKEYKL